MDKYTPVIILDKQQLYDILTKYIEKYNSGLNSMEDTLEYVDTVFEMNN
jgi:hypothetical protein